MPETLSPTPKLDPIGIRPTAFESETILPDLMLFFGEDRTAVTRRAWFFLWQNRFRLENPTSEEPHA